MDKMRNDGYDIARDVNKSIANKDQELYDTISKYGYNQDFATFRRRVATESGYRKRVYDSVAKAGFNVGFGFDEWDNEHVLDHDFRLDRISKSEKSDSSSLKASSNTVSNGQYKMPSKDVLDLINPNPDVVRINNQLKRLDEAENRVRGSKEYLDFNEKYYSSPFSAPLTHDVNLARQRRQDLEYNFPELASIRRQREELKKQLQTIESASRKDDAWYQKLGRGAWNAAKSLDTWDMGMGQIENLVGVRGIVSKIESGKPLEDYEMDELSTLAATTFVNSKYGKDISSWEKIGGGVVESVSFMAEMALWTAMTGGTGTLGAMAAKGGSKQMSKMLMKKLGQEGYKKLIESTSGKILRGLGKGALRVGGDAVQSVVMANTTGAARTAADAIDRNMGVAMPELDAEGNIHYAGHEGGVGLGEAIFKAETAQTIEYASEMAGEYFEPLGKLVGKGFNKLPANRLTNSIRRGVRKASNSGAVRYSRELGNAVHFNSPVGETAEEYVGGLMNALIVGDQTLDADPETGLFTREMFNQTVGVTGVTSLLFLGIGGVRYGGVRAKVHHQLKASDKAGKQMFGEDWDGIKKSIEGRSLEELNDYYNYVEANAESEEQSDVIQRYVRAYLADVGTQIGGALGIKEEVNEQLDGARREMQVRLSESDKNGERLFGEVWADVKADIEGRSSEELDDLYNNAERYTQVEGGADAIREYILAYKTVEANNVSAKREASVSEEERMPVSDKSDWSDKSDVVTTEASDVPSGEGIGVPTTEASGVAIGEDNGLDAIEAASMDPAVVGEAAFNTDGYRAGVRSEVVGELGGEEAVHNGAVTTVGIKGLYGDFTLVGGDFKVTSNERGGLELEGDRDGVVYYRDSDGAVKPTLLGDIGDVKSSVDVETEVSARIEAAREAYRGANEITSEQSGVSDDTETTENVNGDGFALNSSGGIDFGEVTSEMGLPAAPIRMNENSLEHIESRHGDEIRGAGFNDAREFVEYVSSNFTRIKEGTNAEGSPNGTYLLQVEGKHNDTLYVEFTIGGGYWNVNSGGVFNGRYGDNKRTIWSASVGQNKASEPLNTSPSTEQGRTTADATRAVSISSSQGKGSENVGDTKSDPSREVTDRGDQVTDPARVVGGRDYKGDEKSGGEQGNVSVGDNVGQGVTEEVRDEQAMLGTLEELEGRFGVQITVHRDASSIRERSVREAIEAGDTVKGWYNTRDRSVHVYLPQAEGVGDITSTYLHEVVAHYGMRALLGEEKYNDFLEILWGKLDAEERSDAMKAANMGGMSVDELSLADIRLACDEYVASIAEHGDFEGKDRATWRKMVDAMLEILGEFLDKLGVSDRDAVSIVEDLLSMSARNLERTADKGKGNMASGTEVASDSRVRVREDGSKDYVGAGVEATIDDLFMETGNDADVVDSAVQAGISEAESKVEEAEVEFEKRKKKVKGVQGVIALAKERKATMSKLEGEVKFWQEVWDRLHPKQEESGVAPEERVDINGNAIDEEGRLVVDRIESIDDLTDEDFESPTRSVELPKIPANVDSAIGADGKPVVIKKNIFEKNRERHRDLSAIDSRRIIGEALYNPNLYGNNQKNSRPYNWILIHTKDRLKAIVLEVNRNKDNVEVVNWHYLDEKTLAQKERQAIKEGGLILSLESEAGNALNSSSSESKGSDNVGDVQEDGGVAPEERVDINGNAIDEEGRLVVDRIESIDDLTDEDFESPTRSVELPKIPANVDSAIGADGKPVVIKKNIFEKNRERHKFTPEESRAILKKALYDTDLIGQSQPISKPNYWVAIKVDSESPLVVLEVNRNKDNVEIVGWYSLDERNLDRIKRQADREGGELLILSKDTVDSLSTPTVDSLPSDGKGSDNVVDVQEEGASSEDRALSEKSEKTAQETEQSKETERPKITGKYRLTRSGSVKNALGFLSREQRSALPNIPLAVNNGVNGYIAILNGYVLIYIPTNEKGVFAITTKSKGEVTDVSRLFRYTSILHPIKSYKGKLPEHAIDIKETNGWKEYDIKDLYEQVVLAIEERGLNVESVHFELLNNGKSISSTVGYVPAQNLIGMLKTLYSLGENSVKLKSEPELQRIVFVSGSNSGCIGLSYGPSSAYEGLDMSIDLDNGRVQGGATEAEKQEVSNEPEDGALSGGSDKSDVSDKSEELDVQFRRSLNGANSKQKQAGGAKVELDDDVLFRLTKRGKSSVDSWLKKREDLTNEEREAFMRYIDPMDNNLAMATGWWYAKGVIRVPEDQSKVDDAVEVAKRAKVDPLRYGSPMEVLDTFKEYKIRGEAIDPESVPQLSGGRNVGNVSYGIRIYDVEDSKAGQQAMREIINTHWGEDANPWCLLQGDGEGNLRSDAWDYWNHYNGVSKRVAFKEGKLFTFCANDNNSDCWWDRQDDPHSGIPVDMKMPNDELGREATYDMNEDGTFDNPTNIHKGNKQNGVYEEWLDEKQLWRRINYKNGKRNGLREVWHFNGQLKVRENYKDGKLDGLREEWYDDGELKCRENYKNEELDGISEEWDINGQIRTRKHYKDGNSEGLFERYYPNGILSSRESYKNNTKAGVSEEWYENGVLKLRENFRDGFKSGLTEEWYENGQLRVRSNWKNNFLDGLYEEWDQSGNLIIRSIYKGHELVEDLTDAVRFRRNSEELEGIKKRAEADGRFMKAPNGEPTKLNEDQWLEVRSRAFKDWFGDWELPHQEVKVVEAAPHQFKNFNEARAWAKENIARVYSDEETGGKGEIRISRSSIDKFLTESSVLKSTSLDAHLSTIRVLPTVISNSVIGEKHSDYIKDRDGLRSDRSVINSDVTILRLYGAININGDIYRVKTTLKKDTRGGDFPSKAYSYETTKIELIAGTLGKPIETTTSDAPNTINSISVAKLLKDVEKSYEKGKYLLDDYSKVVDENGEPLVMYHGTPNKDFFKFDINSPSLNGRGEGKGFYFIADYDIAKKYAGRYGRVIPAFLNVRRFWSGFDSLSPEEKKIYLSELNDEKAYDKLGIDAFHVGGQLIVRRPNQIKSATDNVGSFSGESDDIRFRRSLNEANSKQKQAGGTKVELEDDVLFRLTKRGKSSVDSWLKKREDLTNEEREAFMQYLEPMDNNLAMATGWWYAKGVIRVPEDQSKVDDAVEVAKRAKVDPLRYGSPMEVLDTFKEYKIKGEAIDPESVPQLSGGRNVGDVSYGIRVYDVEDSKAGQQAMREIINTHWGEDANPWCLLQGDGEGNLRSDAWDYWNHYNGVSKRVAFKDGKLLAFCANDDNSDCWWDRQDEPHDDISFDMKIPNDELGREATYEISGKGRLSKPTNIRNGNKQNGVYEEWYDEEQISIRENYKNGKLDGVCEEWYDNGQLMEHRSYKDGKLEGVSESWYSNGQLMNHSSYKDGKLEGVDESWYAKGQLMERSSYKDGKLEGVSEIWYPNGQLECRNNYKDGKKSGLCEEWKENGKLSSRKNYKDDTLSGVSEEWYENGQLKSRTNYKDGDVDGLREVWFDNGQMLTRSNWVNDQLDGLYERWKENGQLFSRKVYKEGNVVEDLTDDVRFRRGKDIEAVNERFNEELGEQIAGKQKAGHVYQLGMPSDVLRSAGVPDLPIELAASRLKAKSEQKNHPFNMGALKGLPIALSEPIAVFDYGDGKKSQNVIVDLESGGKNFLVGIFFNQAQRGVEVNDIRGLFPKDMEEWLNWATQGKLRYVDKERVLNLIGQRRINLAEVTYLDLGLATKVVKDFENPKLEGSESSDVRFRKASDELKKREGEGLGEYAERMQRYHESVNDRFNEELLEQIAGKQQAGHVYQLGMPSDVLRSAGVPDLPIELAARTLNIKSQTSWHKFNLSLVRDLPRAIQMPIMVFDSHTVAGSKVVLTELKDGDNNFVAVLKVSEGLGSMLVNDIRSVYPKDHIQGVIDWINAGNLLRYADKEKALDWLNSQHSYRTGTETPIKGFVSATKIVKDFDNPKLEGSDVRFRKIGDELKKREGEGLGEYAERMQRYHEANGRVSEASRVGEKPIYKGGSIGEYAQEVTAYNDDPQVLLRGVGSVSIPKAPEVTSKMSIADVAKEMNDYHHRVREVNKRLEEDMRKCRSVSGRFKYNFVDRAAALETFNESMRASGIDVPPELDAYSDMMRSAGMSNIQLDKARFDVLNPLEEELSRHSKLINKSETFKGLRLEFRDKETGELLEGGDEAVSAFRIEGLYLQALDIIEAEELGLVGRGRSGFSEGVVLDGKSVTPEEFVKLYEGVVGFAPAKRLQSRVKSCTDYILDICRAGGLIGEEAYREYRSGRMHYVPQRSWEKRGVSGLSVSDVLDRVASGSVFNPAVIEAKGRESLASNPLPFISNILQSSIFSMRANATKQKMLEWVERNYKELSDMGVVGLRRVYYVAKTDPVSGEVVRNEAGEVVYVMTTTAPSSEMLEEDAATRKSIKEVKKEISDLKKELKSGKIEEEAYDEQIDELESRLKELEDSIVVKFRGGDAPIEDVLTGGEKARNMVTVLRDGVEYQLQFNSRYGGDLVADVLNRNWATKAIGDHWITRGVGKVTRKMSSLMTQYNPFFASANLIRDFGFASISNLTDYGVGYQARFMKNMVRVSKAVAKYVIANEAKRTNIDGDDGTLKAYLREYFDLGAQTGWSYLPSVEELGKDMQRAVDPTTMQKVGNVVFWTNDKIKAVLSGLTEVSELTTRFAAYVTARETMNKDGQPRWSKEECAMMSKELTTNFDRRGAMSGVLGSMYGFFNASVQGTKALARLANRNKGKVAGAVSLFTILGFIQALLQPDDDDDDVTLLPFSEWDLMTNLCIGDYKIPLPHGFRGFWGFGTQLGLYVRGEKSLTDAVYNGLNSLVNALAPEQVATALEALCSYNEMTGELGPEANKLMRLLPSAILPPVEVAINLDFRGEPISRKPYSTRDEASDMVSNVSMSRGQASEFMTAIAEGLFELAGGDPDSGSRMKRDGSGMVPWWVDFNPSQMEHIWDGYSGVGKVVLDVMDYVVRKRHGDEKPFRWNDLQIAKPFTKRNVGDFKLSEREMLDVRRQNGYLKELLRKTKDPQLMEEMQAPLNWGMDLDQAYDWAMENGTYAQKVYLQKLMSDSVLKGYEDGNLSGDDALRIGKELSRNYRVKVMK